jgi:hypothetical protein
MGTSFFRNHQAASAPERRDIDPIAKKVDMGGADVLDRETGDRRK